MMPFMPIDPPSLLKDIHARYEYLKDSFELVANHPDFEPDSPEDERIIYGKSVSKFIEEAKSFRSKGNKLHRDGKYSEALLLYTKSVSASLPNSLEIALAYANRSAVLFMMEKYVPCVLDINRALAGDYPIDSRPKLHSRKERCLNRIRDSGGNADQIADETDPPVDSDWDDEEWRNMCNFNNPLLPNTSSKVGLMCNDQWGRHMVATEDIEPGEILSTEKYISTDVIDRGLHKNCFHCLVACVALIPCHSCTTMYCSERCRLQAYDSYHRIECQMRPFYSQEYVGHPQRMAIRMLLIGTKQGADLQNIMSSMSIENIFAENVDPTNEPLQNDYASSLTTCRIFDQSILKLYTEIAVQTVMVLRDLSFFDISNSERSSMNSSEVFVAALLLNHFYCHWKNRHLFLSKNQNLNSLTFGQRFFHTLLNHSCDPNAFNIQHKQENVLVALRPIKKGEQIFLNYFRSFVEESKENRLDYLNSNYDFECHCEACSNNWPTTEGLVSRGLTFIRGDEDKVTQEVLNIVTPALNDRIQNLENSEIRQMVVHIVKLMNTHLLRPSVPIFMTEQLLGIFMTQVYDTFFPIQRTSATEKSFLNTVEKVVDEMNSVPVDPKYDGLMGIMNIVEKFYINLRRRFSENRFNYVLS